MEDIQALKQEGKNSEEEIPAFEESRHGKTDGTHHPLTS